MPEDAQLPFVVLASRGIKNITAEEAEILRRALQTIYGAWAGVMVGGGRSDAEIRLALRSATLVLDCHGNPLLGACERAMKIATAPEALAAMRG